MGFQEDLFQHIALWKSQVDDPPFTGAAHEPKIVIEYCLPGILKIMEQGAAPENGDKEKVADFLILTEKIILLDHALEFWLGQAIARLSDDGSGFSFEEIEELAATRWQRMRY